MPSNGAGGLQSRMRGWGPTGLASVTGQKWLCRRVDDDRRRLIARHALPVPGADLAAVLRQIHEHFAATDSG
jgi:hypothetical protein